MDDEQAPEDATNASPANGQGSSSDTAAAESPREESSSGLTAASTVSESSRSVATPIAWALAGVAAAGLGIATTEIFTGTFVEIPSLVTSVGEILIPYTPAPVKDWAIATFGTTDKAVLNGGTIAITLLLGAIAGVLSQRSMRLAAIPVISFGVIGTLAAAGRPLASPVLIVFSTAVAVSLVMGFLFATRWTARALADAVAKPGSSDAAGPGAGDVTRRVVLASAATTGLAAFSLSRFAGKLIRDQLTVDVPEIPVGSAGTVREVAPVMPTNALDVDGITPIVMPNDEFYRIDTALRIPVINAQEWELRVHGLVDEETTFTYEDLLKMRQIEAYVTLSCVSNEVGGDLVGNAKWTGVPLTDVLSIAGVQPGATQIVGRAIDDWDCGFPTELALDGRDAMVALRMNDEPLPAAHGFPARLVIPGLYGYVSATKWLTEIELTTLEGFDGYWIPRGWSKEGPIKTQSRIDVPAADSSVSGAGGVQLAGIAWAVHRGISGVEVRVFSDGGSPEAAEWQAADVSSPLSDDAWVQWRVQTELDAGEYRAEVRATDGEGMTQSAEEVPPRPNGAEGYDSHRFTVE